jgi:alpha-L-fucosidase
MLRILAFLALITQVVAYQPTKENLQSREWFQDSKFGLFVHWGAYSVFEMGEWVLEKTAMPLSTYEKVATSRFNPVNFDPVAWVTLAKNAGMKYITITSRHHDGFAMWGTKQNGWNIVDGSRYHADPLKLLAAECQRQGIKLFFYYSQLDWHHPDYFPWGMTGHFSGRLPMGDFNRYLDYMDAQLTELLTEYGPIAGIWFDGMWDKPQANWRLDKTYSLIHRLQPAALIGSNHHIAPFEGEDIQTFERDLPGESKHGFNDTSVAVSALPLEMCETMNNSWGYNRDDHSFKSTKEIIHHIVRAAGNNANFLLNIGPRPDGTIQPESIERLQEVGIWMKEYGESIYGTRGGPIKPMPWGVSTQKGNKVYLHILNLQQDTLEIPNIGNVQARSWPSGVPIAVEQNGDTLLLQIPTLDEIDTIIELVSR